MNYSGGSEWNNGCESGWTGYLQESYPCPTYNTTTIVNNHHLYNPNYYESNSTSRNDASEVDLSMLSDASSGPPHFLQDDQHIYEIVKKNVRDKKSKKVMKEKKKREKYQQYHCNYGDYDTNNSIANLDDTASSPIITYSKIQGDSTFSTKRDCWQYSHPRGADFAEPSHLGGRRFKD